MVEKPVRWVLEAAVALVLAADAAALMVLPAGSSSDGAHRVGPLGGAVPSSTAPASPATSSSAPATQASAAAPAPTTQEEPVEPGAATDAVAPTSTPTTTAASATTTAPRASSDAFEAPTATATSFLGCTRAEDGGWSYQWSVTASGGSQWAFRDGSGGPEGATSTVDGRVPPPADDPYETVATQFLVRNLVSGRFEFVRLPPSLVVQVRCSSQ